MPLSGHTVPCPPGRNAKKPFVNQLNASAPYVTFGANAYARVGTTSSRSIQTSNSREGGADNLRALATVAVVAIHASTWFVRGASLNGVPYRAIAALCDFSVPAFVVLAGYLLARTYSDRETDAQYVRRRARRTIVPWLFWAPIFFLFDVASGQLSSDPQSIGNWWTSGGGHLYFLLLIPQLYALFMVWPRRHRVMIAGVAIAMQIGLCTLRLWISPTSGLVDTLTIWYGFLLFPYWIGYFAFGIAIEKLKPFLQRHRVSGFGIALLLAAAGGWLVLTSTYRYAQNPSYASGTGAFITPLMPLFVVPLCALLLMYSGTLARRSRHVSRAVAILSSYSLGIYLVHPLVLFALALLLNGFIFIPVLDGVLGFIILAGATLGVSAILASVISRTPLAFSLGTGQPRQVTSSAARKDRNEVRRHA
jgi:surface polysaccharide O-acyltransferase-like enzyme